MSDRDAALLPSPNLDGPAAGVRTIAFIVPSPHAARSRWRHRERRDPAVSELARTLEVAQIEASSAEPPH